MQTPEVSVVGRDLLGRRLARRLAEAAGLDVVEPLPGAPSLRAALLLLPAWSAEAVDEAARIARDLDPVPLVVLTEDCTDHPCRELKARGVAGCVPISTDVRQTARSLSAAVTALDRGGGEQCPRCPLGVRDGDGPMCTSFLPDTRRPAWAGHERRAAPCFPFIAGAPTMKGLEERAQRVAASDVTVLITGESGTGKEVLARYIHRCGSRARAPFVKVNCAALPDHLLESELFGYEKGAFTDAGARKPGRFEGAQGGIVFLDEISEISLGLQAKLLQVLESKSFHRLGGVDEITVDVQILAATNRDLEQAVSSGLFRADLYYRLKVIALDLPPLRERRDDIPRLVDYFLCRLSRQYSQPTPELGATVLEALCRAPWPGNVRELENTLRQLVILGDEASLLEELSRTGGRPRISSDEAPPALPSTPIDGESATLDLKSAARRAAREAERDAILTALNRTRWNRAQAARLLRVSYKTLLTKMKNLLPHGA